MSGGSSPGWIVWSAMPRPAPDPLLPMLAHARALKGVQEGVSCNQHSFKAGKATFFTAGPGAKGAGFKAMFKLSASVPEAERLASREPERFEVGKGGWVTARFTAEAPLPKTLWVKWLAEAFGPHAQRGE